LNQKFNTGFFQISCRFTFFGLPLYNRLKTENVALNRTITKLGDKCNLLLEKLKAKGIIA